MNTKNIGVYVGSVVTLEALVPYIKKPVPLKDLRPGEDPRSWRVERKRVRVTSPRSRFLRKRVGDEIVLRGDDILRKIVKIGT